MPTLRSGASSPAKPGGYGGCPRAASLVETLAPYLTDRRDRALLSQTPALMMPRFGDLPELPLGGYRYVTASDGLYIQARTKALAVTLRLAETPPMPYGDLAESVDLTGGLLPRSLYDRIAAGAALATPQEWAGIVTWENGAYRLHEAKHGDRSPGHIRYGTESVEHEAIAVDVHSHGKGPAYFSATDDADDAGGIYIATVLGRVGANGPTEAVSRVCIHGTFYNLPWNPWAD